MANFFVLKKGNQSAFTLPEEICFLAFVWRKGFDWGSGALWFVQLDACSSEIDLPILYVCEVCNGVYSRISILLKAFQKPYFITKKI